MTINSHTTNTTVKSPAKLKSVPDTIPAGWTGSGAADTEVTKHLDNVLPALESLRSQAGRLSGWGTELANRLLAGQRLLAAGNGGSAAEAQHLTAELVGRFDSERAPFSAISLLLLSTSGRSPNLLKAVRAANERGIATWALTGPGPNPLSTACDEAVTVEAIAANAQEGHLIAVHAVCRAFDAEVARRTGTSGRGVQP